MDQVKFVETALKIFTLSILEYLDPYLSICMLFQQLLETSHQTK